MSNHQGELSTLSEPEPPPARAGKFFFPQLPSSLFEQPRPSSRRLSLGRHAIVSLVAESGHHTLEAALSPKVSSDYRLLDSDHRHHLESEVISAMATQAAVLSGEAEERHVNHYKFHTQALMNHVPLLFEPYDNATLVGQWIDEERTQLVLKSEKLALPEQQLILLGGLTTFLTFMQQHNR